jgi:hypothetical protein
MKALAASEKKLLETLKEQLKQVKKAAKTQLTQFSLILPKSNFSRK